MSVPNAPVRPTPANLDPPDTVCLQIEVPNDRQWIAAFYDAVIQLSYWYAWDRDDAHTGREIAARWWKVFLSIRKCNPEQPMDGCCDGSEDTLIRQNPDNPCLLESSADGIHWCTLFDQSLCTPANGQPGGGSEQPDAGGGQACYHADFPANMQWNLPTIVSTGDVIEVKNRGGQATDAPNHVWYCPNGQLFFAGGCVSVPFTQGGDPAVAANHMTIVCQIAGVWYPTDSPVTVPGGVTNAPVVFQVNDGTLSDNSGGYNFDVCVTNNATVQFTHHFDFRLSPSGFVIAPWAGATNAAWVAGTGFTVSQPGPVVTHSGALDIGLNNTHSLSHAVLRFKGTATDGANGQYLFQQTATFPPPALGEFYTQAVNGAIDFQHAFTAALTKFGVANDLGATIGATGTITDCYVTADGVDPF